MFRRGLLFCVISILISGCTISTSHEQNESFYEGEEIERIGSKEIDKYPMSLLYQRNFDLMQTGTEQSIEMYADVEKVMIDGVEEYAWDDGERWLLVVKDSDKSYPLFDNWVQLGKLTFWLFELEETRTLVLLHSATAGFHLQTFTFDKNNDEFVRKSVYNPTGNLIFWGGSIY